MSTKKNFFRRQREKMGVTQRQIADALRMTCASVSYWEHGGVPDLRLVPRLAPVYQVSERRLALELLQMAKDSPTFKPALEPAVLSA